MKFIASTILFFFAFLACMTTAAPAEDTTKTAAAAAAAGGLRGRALFNAFDICPYMCSMYHRCNCKHDYPYCADYEDHRYDCN